LFSNEARLRCIKLTSQSRGIRRISLSRGGIAYSFHSSGDPGASRWSGGDDEMRSWLNGLRPIFPLGQEVSLR